MFFEIDVEVDVNIVAKKRAEVARRTNIVDSMLCKYSVSFGLNSVPGYLL